MTQPMPISATSKRPDLISLAMIGAHLALVFTPVYLVAYLGFGWWLLPCWLAFGFLMNGTLNLMHEAAHYHVFRSRTANDWLGHWILGPLSGTDFDSYRQRHWDHHRHLGEPDDPKVTYRQDIRGWRLLRHALRCLLLVEAFGKFQHQRQISPSEAAAPNRVARWFLRTAWLQFVFLTSLTGVAWLGHAGDARAIFFATATAYGFIYVYSLGSLTVFAANLRALAEHQIAGPEALHTGAAALRNFSCNVVTRLCFGAYGFGEHATHHRLPAIPYYRLIASTATLAQKDPAMSPTHGYLQTIATLVRRS